MRGPTTNARPFIVRAGMTARDDGYHYRVRNVVRIIDGDTYHFEVDLGFRQYAVLPFRLAGYDTPETYRPKSEEERERGQQAARFAEEWLSSHHDVRIQTFKDPDSFGRWLAVVYCADDEQSLGDDLASAGLAEIYDR